MGTPVCKHAAQLLLLKERLDGIPRKLASARVDLSAVARRNSYQVSSAAQETIAAVCDVLDAATKEVAAALNSIDER